MATAAALLHYHRRLIAERSSQRRPPGRSATGLFLIGFGSHRVHLVGCTAHSDDAWMTQQVGGGLVERERLVRSLIRDRDR